MCGPLAIVGGALLASGMGMNMIGDDRARGAQQRANRLERERQQKLTAEQDALFAQSLSRSADTAGPAREQAVDTRGSRLAQAIVPMSEASYLPGSSSANQVVRDTQTEAVTRANADSSQLAAALAQLGGTQDAMQQLGIGLGRNSQGIGQVGSFKRGSANVLDAELQAAAWKGAGLRGLGSLFQQVGGQMLGSGIGNGMSGMFAGKNPMVVDPWTAGVGV